MHARACVKILLCVGRVGDEWGVDVSVWDPHWGCIRAVHSVCRTCSWMVHPLCVHFYRITYVDEEGFSSHMPSKAGGG